MRLVTMETKGMLALWLNKPPPHTVDASLIWRLEQPGTCAAFCRWDSSPSVCESTEWVASEVSLKTVILAWATLITQSALRKPDIQPQCPHIQSSLRTIVLVSFLAPVRDPGSRRRYCPLRQGDEWVEVCGALRGHSQSWEADTANYHEEKKLRDPFLQ